MRETRSHSWDYKTLDKNAVFKYFLDKCRAEPYNLHVSEDLQLLCYYIINESQRELSSESSHINSKKKAMLGLVAEAGQILDCPIIDQLFVKNLSPWYTNPMIAFAGQVVRHKGWGSTYDE
jgi:hypothetical protein